MRKVFGYIRQKTKQKNSVQDRFERFIITGLVLFTMVQSLPALAQQELYDDSRRTSESVVDGSGETNNGLVVTGNSAINMAILFNTTLGGPTVNENGANALKKYPVSDEASAYGLIGYVNGANQSMIDNMPQTDVFQYVAQEWVPGYESSSTSVYAQDGYGYLAQLNITELHNRFRLIAYMLFVVVMIATGFMIMFRQKIGGQVAITLFNSLPRVAWSLILVTFSFAIVGLVMDFGALLIRILGSVLAGGYTQQAVTGPFTLVWSVFNIGLLKGTAISGGVAGGIGAIGFLPVLGGALAFLQPLALVGLVLLGVILFIVLTISFRVFMTLVKAYLGLIIDAVIGPIILAISALPGQNGMAKDWFYRVLKNTLTFVLVFFFVNFALYLQSIGINWAFPEGLASGGSAAGGPVGGGIVSMIINLMLPLFLFNLAASSPNFLDDFLPQSGGKGAAAAIQGAQQGMSKLPVIGGLFG